MRFAYSLMCVFVLLVLLLFTRVTRTPSHHTHSISPTRLSTHSCFFNVELPRFSSERVLRERLLYAMQTTTMNADEMPAS